MQSGHAVKLLLKLAQVGQLLVPASLEFTGDKPVLGINRIVLAACTLHLVPGLPASILDLLSLVTMLLALRLHGSQRRLDAERLQLTENLLGHGPVNPHTAEADAVVDGLVA